MNYYQTDPLVYAREVANQICGSLYFAGNFEDLDLPDPNNFTDRSVIVHFDRVYLKNGSSWIELTDNRYNLGGLYIEHEADYKTEEKTDTTPWLALLEE